MRIESVNHRIRMKVLNMHERVLNASVAQVGRLIDSLSSSNDLLWPARRWPRLRFDRPLGVGATGGHGPIRYFVEAYAPGRSVRFRFTGPAGFDGFHGFDLVAESDGRARLRHTLQMRTYGLARFSWPLVYRPLHDALMEDALATAEISVGQAHRWRRWSPWVRLLRAVVSRGAASPVMKALSAAQDNA